ncbi:uncharacterized protein LOC132639268 [Lycium barbarum]|uniref:uncharacterized protein LOC132639268 n=1 Tax=Lycium barbarum TaxID=112863 RepID=UPI00293F174B|nr:uncharacterized protein LOC132639268 [Lycium barbarum]
MLWGKKPKQACWIIQKVLKAQKYMAGLTEANLIQMPSFSIKNVYHKMLGTHTKVPWRKLMCNNPGSPKWLFILFLVIHRRLYTKDRLIRWGMQICPKCPLCENEPECIDHLFFQCSVTTAVWKILQWQGIRRTARSWSEELQWCETRNTGKGSDATIYRMSLAATVYELWLERNHKAFQSKRRSEVAIVKKIIQEVFVRIVLKV